MKNLIIASLLLLSFGFAPAQAQQTKVLTADKHNEYGLVYNLPVTALKVDVEAHAVHRIRGPYYQYAKKFIGTDKVVAENADVWTITSVKVTPYGVADTENQYLMQLKPGAVTFIGVADDGMLLSINKKPADFKAPAATPVPENPTPRSGKEYLKFVDEDFIASQSSLKQAQMLAESLMEVRDAKISLTRGTAETMPTDGRQLELMLQSLEEQERSMMEAFTGVVNEETTQRSFTFIPDAEGKVTLFRFSDFAGFVDVDDLSGDPVTISTKLTREPELPVDAKGEEKKIPKDAVIYNIPGAAAISISLNGKTLWNQEEELAQFGTIFGLNPSLFTDKKEPSCAEFSPVTGALLNISSISPEE